MNKEFFHSKIIQLSDDKLVELLRTTNNEFNKEVFQLATEEAAKRNLEYDLSRPVIISEAEDQDAPELLKKWNWGAFSFAPVWGLVYKLQWLATLSFIPVIGIFVALYLGVKGNSLAFEKSKTLSVSEFMIVQKKWNYWGKVYLWFFIACILLATLIFLDAPEPLYKESEQPFRK